MIKETQYTSNQTEHSSPDKDYYKYLQHVLYSTMKL